MRNSEQFIAPRAFIAVDCLFVGFALIVALCWADQLSLPVNLSAFLNVRFTVKNLLRGLAVFGLWAILMRCFRVYTSHAVSPLSEALRIAAAVVGASLLLANSFDQFHKGASAAHIATDFALFCFISLYGVRALVAFLTHHTQSAILGRRNVIIVGTGPRAVRAYRFLRTERHRTHSLLGFTDCRTSSLTPGEVESLFLGPLANLESILLHQPVDEVIIALPARCFYAEIEQTIGICARVGIEVQYPEDTFPSAGAIPRDPRQHPAMISLKPATHDARMVVKRLLDIVCSAVALLVLAPLMLVIAGMVKFTSPGPIFFRQDRYGLGRRRFRIFKFRTMVADAESRLREVEYLNEAHGPAFKIRNDPRVTRVGALLRRTSLDELPQLFNVIAGQMSLVGPRPLSVRDVSLFNQASLMRRFSVKPGMTCLWQVNDRSHISFDQWMELDFQYIDNWSLGLDAKILALTIPAVVKGTGV